MHRSGTSCLTGIIEENGVNLGVVSKWNTHNHKGNRENKKIMLLHNRLLKFNNGSWDNPPEEVIWPDHLKRERDTILKDYKGFSLFGLKDPRFALTLDGWLEVLGKVSIAGTFRHPYLVARSLHKRESDMSLEKGYELWKIYNEKILEYHEQLNFPIISFDLPVKDYLNGVIKMMTALEISTSKCVFSFFNASLRHQVKPADDGVPPDIMALYKKLKEIALC
jgi:hypothetical protein